jgi:hypothetical protein
LQTYKRTHSSTLTTNNLLFKSLTHKLTNLQTYKRTHSSTLTTTNNLLFKALASFASGHVRLEGELAKHTSSAPISATAAVAATAANLFAPSSSSFSSLASTFSVGNDQVGGGGRREEGGEQKWLGQGVVGGSGVAGGGGRGGGAGFLGAPCLGYLGTVTPQSATSQEIKSSLSSSAAAPPSPALAEKSDKISSGGNSGTNITNGDRSRRSSSGQVPTGALAWVCECPLNSNQFMRVATRSPGNPIKQVLSNIHLEYNPFFYRMSTQAKDISLHHLF